MTTRRRARTDRTRAALVLWGGWLLVTATAFSFGQGIIHPYYSVALAPAIGAVVGIGAVTLWRQRSRAAWYLLVGVFVATVAWSVELLARTPTWQPWLRTLLALGGLSVAAALLVWPLVARRPSRVVVAAAVVLALLAPGAYTVATAATAHRGAIPSAGPSAGGSGPGGAPPAGPRGGGGGPGGATTGGPARGLLDGTTVSSRLRSYLTRHRSDATWLAATVGANDAASYQLATREPVLAIGGFNGTDPAPTLATFARDVAEHRIDFFLAPGGSGLGGGRGSTQATAADRISTWVAAHFPARVVDGTTTYLLR